jgi:hypothetical protein
MSLANPIPKRSQVKPRVAYHKLHYTPLMIVANVVPRPPRSSYNLLDMRDGPRPVDLVVHVEM